MVFESRCRICLLAVVAAAASRVQVEGQEVDWKCWVPDDARLFITAPGTEALEFRLLRTPQIASGSLALAPDSSTGEKAQRLTKCRLMHHRSACLDVALP
jgi:hypothetical protein